VIDWDRILINVIAGLSIITAFYLLLIGYRYILNVIGTGKIRPSKVKYAELYTLLNNRSAQGEIQFLFILRSSTKVRFAIVDKDDSEVKLLIDEQREPGNYPVSFDTTTVPNGVYFYQLKTDLQKITKVFKINND
jgi:hypothetical protein